MSEDRAQDERNQIGADQEIRSSTRGGLSATAFGLSDIGCHRSVNQDTLGNRIGQFVAGTETLGLLYAIADGMGGHARGEVASAIAIAQLFTRYYESDATVEARQTLARVMRETNTAVYQAGREANSGTMGTTLTTVLLRDTILYVGNIGDSRTYLIRSGKIKQLSEDHSLIGEQVRSGLLTEAQARTSSIRNVITRAVGYREQVEPDTFAFTVHVGDILLLCSDGLHGLVENEELARIISTKGLGEATKELIELARKRGGPDNITALLVRIDQLGEASAAAGIEQSPQIAATDPDDDTTKPLPKITLAHTDEIVTDPVSNDATTAEAVTLPSARLAQGTMTSPPPPIMPPPPAQAAEKPAAIIPPASRQARAPIWLFVLIPLLLIGIVAAGAFAVVRGRSNEQQNQPIIALTSTVLPTIGSTATPSPVGVPAIVPTPSATPSAPSASATPAPVGAQPTTASGPGGLPVLPRVTPSSTVGAGGGAPLGQRARISGTVRFGDNVTIPENFPRDWIVVLIDQADWQQRRLAAEPRAQAQITASPANPLPGSFKEGGVYMMEFDLPEGNQSEDLFVIQVRQEDNMRTATTESNEIRIDRSNRTNTITQALLITGITEQLEPKPAQSPTPGGQIGVERGMANSTRAVYINNFYAHIQRQRHNIR